MTAPEQVAEPVVQEWSFRGFTLPAGDGGGPRLKGGRITLDSLEEFVRRVRAEMPEAYIVVHEYGIRAIVSERDPRHAGPKLDWSDWE